MLEGYQAFHRVAMFMQHIYCAIYTFLLAALHTGNQCQQVKLSLSYLSGQQPDASDEELIRHKRVQAHDAHPDQDCRNIIAQAGQTICHQCTSAAIDDDKRGACHSITHVSYSKGSAISSCIDCLEGHFETARHCAVAWLSRMAVCDGISSRRLHLQRPLPNSMPGVNINHLRCPF